jgi:hypothetical protein
VWFVSTKTFDKPIHPPHLLSNSPFTKDPDNLKLVPRDLSSLKISSDCTNQINNVTSKPPSETLCAHTNKAHPSLSQHTVTTLHNVPHHPSCPSILPLSPNDLSQTHHHITSHHITSPTKVKSKIKNVRLQLAQANTNTQTSVGSARHSLLPVRDFTSDY